MPAESQKIFITGASGCVGHYVLDELLKNPLYELYVLVRNPKSLSPVYRTHPQIKFLIGNIKELFLFKEILFEIDFAIHLATPWGGGDILPVNVTATKTLWDLLNPQKVKKILYFSTASIMGPGNKVIDQAATLGTPYIRSKYQAYYLNKKHPLAEKIYTFFPTWIFGGDSTHPYSHASTGIKDLPQILKMLRFFNLDFKFHFIHAADIATVVGQVIATEFPQREIILGQPALSLRQFILEACDFYKIKRRWGLPVPSFIISLVSKFLGDRLSDWDKYCLKQRHFVFKTTAPENFGAKSKAKNTAELLTLFS